EKIVRLGGRALPSRCVFPLRLGRQPVVLSGYSLEPADIGLCVLPAHIDNGLQCAGAGINRDRRAIAVINAGLPLVNCYLGRGQRERAADGYGMWRQFHLEKWRGLERSHHEIAGWDDNHPGAIRALDEISGRRERMLLLCRKRMSVDDPIRLLVEPRPFPPRQRPHNDREQQQGRKRRQLPAAPPQSLAAPAFRRVPLDASLNEFTVGAGQILLALGEPSPGLNQRKAHQERLLLCLLRRCFPSAASRFEPGPPRQELALTRYPFAQLIPAPEYRFVRHLGIGLPRGLRNRDHETIGERGKLRDEPPFLFRELIA